MKILPCHPGKLPSVDDQESENAPIPLTRAKICVALSQKAGANQEAIRMAATEHFRGTLGKHAGEK